MKSTIRIIAAVLITYALIMLSGCQESEPAAARTAGAKIYYEVTANTAYKLPEDYYTLALVDINDKFEQVSYFDYDHVEGAALLDTGDLLEIRMYSTGGAFDKSLTFDVIITQGDQVTEHKAVPYTGVKYLVK